MGGPRRTHQSAVVRRSRRLDRGGSQRGDRPHPHLKSGQTPATQSRAVFEQVEGVLMTKLHCTAEEAFQHMALRSQRANRKLRDIAQDVVEQLWTPRSRP
ncbi:ANTAR domain-containing protein [Kineococcus sp. NPDC059986]|uniref:ANTAR domain-containing protein n=1 Tax=Kineococcus sp. NPDC059986 TaxID=3155538 RepID=UPI0034501BCB